MQKRGMIFAAALLALLLAAVLAPAALAEVTINDTTFPDETFREYVRQFDTSGDGALSEAEIANTTVINVSSRGIADLTGVEYFTALKFLDCGINALTELDVSANTALEVLYCNANQLTSLNLSKNTALKTLWCYSNDLTSLNVSGCTALQYLYCKSNQLTALNLSQNTALLYLACGDQTAELGVPRGADGTWTADLSKLIKGGENVTNVQTTTQEATASGTTVSWRDEAVEKVVVTYTYNTGYNDRTMSVELTLIPGDAVLYTITFDANGGEVTPLTATTDASGKLASLPRPTRGGYRFAGWYTLADGGARVTENTVFTQDTTIYAHWSADVLPVGGSGEDAGPLPADDLPHITAPSVAQEIVAEAGERAAMAITAENVGTYQWYVDRGDGKGYVPLSGATSAMYETSPVSAANDGYKYICVVTNEHGSATSPVFTLRVLGATALPSTGDGAPLAAWAALLALSGCGAALLKKRKTGEAR